jgi:hypothetical protein
MASQDFCKCFWYSKSGVLGCQNATICVTVRNSPNQICLKKINPLLWLIRFHELLWLKGFHQQLWLRGFPNFVACWCPSIRVSKRVPSTSAGKRTQRLCQENSLSICEEDSLNNCEEDSLNNCGGKNSFCHFDTEDYLNHCGCGRIPLII